MSYLTGQIPELETEPLRIRFHIAGEMVTAVALIVGGIGVLAGQAWSQPVHFIAMGMLMYTAIVSPGYFAQKGQWPLVTMFAGVLVLAFVSIGLVF
jgi:hypothetical protein